MRRDAPRGFLYLACVLLGGYSLLAQVLLAREFLVVFFGNELCLGIILCSWLAGIAIGAQVSGRALRSEASASLAVVWLSLALAIFVPTGLMGARAARILLGTAAGQLIPFGKLWLGTLSIVTPVSFISGATFPLLCAALARGAAEPAWEIGKVYVLEASGTVAAGLLFTYALVGRAGAFHVALGGSIVVVANALGMARAGKLKAAALLASVLLAVAGAGWVSARELERFATGLRWKSFAPGVDHIGSIDSKYENIALGKREDTYVLYANGLYTASFPDPYHYQYFAHTVMVQHPNPKRVLLIGGGIEGLLREMLKHGVEQLDVVLLDPKLQELVTPYLPDEDAAALKDRRVRIVHADGRYFVKTTGDRYDMVVCYLPDPSTGMLNRLYTREFFEDAKRALAEGGVFVTSVSSTVNYIGKEVGDYTGSVYETLLSSFPYVVVTPGATNTFFCSLKAGAVSDDPKVMEQRYEARGVQPSEFKYLYELEIMPPLRTRQLQEKLKERAPGLLNSDFHPVTYFFNLVLWGRYSGSKIAGALGELARLRPWHLLGGIALLLAARLIFLARGRKARELAWRGDILLAIATTGMAAMGLEVVLLLAFQSMYGYVYEKIGMVVAMFMAGLAAGGLAGAKVARDDGSGRARNWAATLCWTEGMIAVFAALVPAALWVLSRLGARPGVEAAFMALVAASGLLTGLEFPIASRAYLATGVGTGMSAGMVDSADHIGAALGAAVAGVILVPLLGIPATCFVLAAANAATGVLQMFHVQWSAVARNE